MIYISKPYIEERGNEIFLVSIVKDESRNLQTELWYSVEKQYGQYLCDDYADSFLLVVLAVAMHSKQDIKIDAPVSSRLLFNVHNTLQPIWQKVLPESKIIKVLAETRDDIIYNGKGVGCGCSLGVDSMSSLYKHMESDVVKGYGVTHLTIFNSGQFGDYDLEGAEKDFRSKVAALRSFSEETGLPVIGINSNLNAFYKYCGVSLLQSFVQRTASCAMALQKLFGKYIYASSYSVEQSEISTIDESHIECAFVPLLSTNNFEMILSNPGMTRVQKTEYISRNPLTHKYLEVCWADQTAKEIWHNTAFLENKTKINCGWCDKYLRTLLTLDIVLGSVAAYGNIFELSQYYSRKREYIVKVFRERKHNYFYQEMVELMFARQYSVPYKAIYYYKKSVYQDKIIMILQKVLGLPQRALNKILRIFKK